MAKPNSSFTVRSQPASRMAWKGRIIWFHDFVALVVCLFSTSALAQTPVPGGYAPNAASGMKAGVMGPGGSYFVENGWLFYKTNKFVDSRGNEIPTQTTNGLSNRTTFGFVPKFKILGANYNPMIIVVFANQVIRPVPNSEKSFQLADAIIQPLALGWHAGEWHTTLWYNLYVPSGRFKAGASNNTGRGLFSHMIAVSETWMQDQPLPWAANLQLGYEINGKQDGTNIRPGDVMTIEGGVGKEWTKGFDLGLLAFASFQTSQEENSAPVTDTSKYKFFGIGPEINWRLKWVAGLQARLRMGFEFNARNNSQGTGGILSILYAF